MVFLNLKMRPHFTETLGQFLKRERESRSISLEEMSRNTRISPPILEALERDDFLFFSRQEFIPGFLKGYARNLGLDSEEVLKRYRIQSELINRQESFRQLPLFPWLPSPEEVKEPENNSRNLPSRKSRKNQSYRGIVIQVTIVIVAICLSLYLHHFMQKTKKPQKSSKADPIFLSPNKDMPSEHKTGIKSEAIQDQGVPPKPRNQLRDQENTYSPQGVSPGLNPSNQRISSKTIP